MVMRSYSKSENLEAILKKKSLIKQAQTSQLKKGSMEVEISHVAQSQCQSCWCRHVNPFPSLSCKKL